MRWAAAAERLLDDLATNPLGCCSCPPPPGSSSCGDAGELSISSCSGCRLDDGGGAAGVKNCGGFLDDEGVAAGAVDETAKRGVAPN